MIYTTVIARVDVKGRARERRSEVIGMARANAIMAHADAHHKFGTSYLIKT